MKSQALTSNPAEKMNVSGIDVAFPEESVGVGLSWWMTDHDFPSALRANFDYKWNQVAAMSSRTDTLVSNLHEGNRTSQQSHRGKEGAGRCVPSRNRSKTVLVIRLLPRPLLVPLSSPSPPDNPCQYQQSD